MRYPEQSLLVVGMAKPSREDAIYATHGEFYISLVLCRETGEILDMGCNTIVGVTAEFVRQLLVGKRLPEELPTLEREIRTRYFALTQKPLIAALKDASNRYLIARGQ
ncbi:DUF3870 domain-containing protein [Oscillibacter sp. MSJ-2]|uniref:DUF3870 domain-containing protein n=1 Tax=Dysosmobacter acutus TaxID=2841504 RepID=A0ABS6F7A1_9FIRM|nr:DUF3870 domain-containing protein [Dysosmobacter acutus]MBU5625925.1 DUF3870 domain-containing protein [Dysosmobacter acutus]